MEPYTVWIVMHEGKPLCVCLLEATVDRLFPNNVSSPKIVGCAETFCDVLGIELIKPNEDDMRVPINHKSINPESFAIYQTLREEWRDQEWVDMFRSLD